jgi:hypothetical protein
VEKVESRCETEDWVEEMKTCGCPHNTFPIKLYRLLQPAGKWMSDSKLFLDYHGIYITKITKHTNCIINFEY